MKDAKERTKYIVKRYNKGKRGEISAAEYQALGDFRYQIRRFLRRSEEAARQAGLEPQQHQLLLAARAAAGEGQPSIGEIAERLQIQHHSAVELVDRSVERGLVRRMRAAGDRRLVLVELTPRGERLLRQLTLSHRAELGRAGPGLVRALSVIMHGRATTGRHAAKR